MHPTSRQLIDYLLDGAQAQVSRVEKHVRRPCPRCADRLKRYEMLLEAMRTDRDAEPPVEWVERAIRIHRAPSPILDRVQEWCGNRREEMARLVFDSAEPSALGLAGTRHIQSGRRVRFEARTIELDLQIEPVGRGGEVTGQVLRLAPDLAPVQYARFLITAGGSEIVAGQTDELGEFTVDLSRTESLCVRVGVDDGLATFSLPEATDL